MSVMGSRAVHMASASASLENTLKVPYVEGVDPARDFVSVKMVTVTIDQGNANVSRASRANFQTAEEKSPLRARVLSLHLSMKNAHRIKKWSMANASLRKRNVPMSADLEVAVSKQMAELSA